MNDLKFGAAGVLGAGLMGALFSTTRVKRVGEESYLHFRRRGTPVIFVFWHGQLLPLIHYHRREDIVALVSDHTDGEYVSRVLQRNGFATVRGSSTRGGQRGLRGLVRAARAGKDLALTPDGPKGPQGVFKAGALAVAQMTGLPVIPLALGTSSSWRFRSWDGFLVPRPLSKIRLEYLPPRFVGRGATREDLERIRGEIGEDLNALTARLNPKVTDPPRESASESGPGENQ